MQNAMLDEAQAWISTAGRNISNLQNADDTMSPIQNTIRSMSFWVKADYLAK